MSEQVYLGVRIPLKLRQIMDEHVCCDTHMNASEFVRDSIREKLHKEAPDLYERLVRAKKMAEASG